jgi:transcriptional regulator with XRE-family HTH domain
MTDIKDVVATNIKKFRVARGWSQAYLAEKADVSPNYIGMLENKIKYPSPNMVNKLSIALDIDPTELFFKEIDPVSIANSYRKAALNDIYKFIKTEISKMSKKNEKDSFTKQ